MQHQLQLERKKMFSLCICLVLIPFDFALDLHEELKIL